MKLKKKNSESSSVYFVFLSIPVWALFYFFPSTTQPDVTPPKITLAEFWNSPNEYANSYVTITDAYSLGGSFLLYNGIYRICDKDGKNTIQVTTNFPPPKVNHSVPDLTAFVKAVFSTKEENLYILKECNKE